MTRGWALIVALWLAAPSSGMAAERAATAAAASSAVAGAPVTGSEIAYVTDMLRLGLHRAADTSDSPFAQLSSGDRLEVLERRGMYARVRVADGREGWVKSGYIVSEVPPRYRLTQLEDEIAVLTARTAEAERASAAVQSATATLRREHAEAVASVGALRDTVMRLERENAEYLERFDASRLSMPLGLVIGALLLTLGFGGVAGWWALDARIRRQHGGYRVY